jgi:hypothetical protein
MISWFHQLLAGEIVEIIIYDKDEGLLWTQSYGSHNAITFHRPKV